VSEADLAKLDAFEECPELYYRREIDVILENGTCLNWMVYWYITVHFAYFVVRKYMQTQVTRKLMQRFVLYL